MYIWPNGEVTGSVVVDALEAYRQSVELGLPLDQFAEFFPDGLTVADYPQPKPKPGPRKASPSKE